MENLQATDLLFGLDWEAWFSHAGLVAMLGWVVLIFAPRRWPAVTLIPAVIAPVILSIGYAVLIFRYFGSAEGGFDSLANVALLFGKEPLLLAGWVHYLAFDLFVGAWIASESDRAGISRVIQAPILVATFMLGPIGLLLYFSVAKGQRLITRFSPQATA